MEYEEVEGWFEGVAAAPVCVAEESELACCCSSTVAELVGGWGDPGGDIPALPIAAAAVTGFCVWVCCWLNWLPCTLSLSIGSPDRNDPSL